SAQKFWRRPDRGRAARQGTVAAEDRMSLSDPACAEDDRPSLRVHLFGKSFAAVADGSISAQGPKCVNTLASQLIPAAYDSSCPIEFIRAGETVNKITLAQAAGTAQGETF